MNSKEWNTHVVGLVSREREDGVRVAVPPAAYRMSESAEGHYVFLGASGIKWTLTLPELARYVNSRDLKIDGEWP